VDQKIGAQAWPGSAALREGGAGLLALAHGDLLLGQAQLAPGILADGRSGGALVAQLQAPGGQEALGERPVRGGRRLGQRLQLGQAFPHALLQVLGRGRFAGSAQVAGHFQLQVRQGALVLLQGIGGDAPVDEEGHRHGRQGAGADEQRLEHAGLDILAGGHLLLEGLQALGRFLHLDHFVFVMRSHAYHSELKECPSGPLFALENVPTPDTIED